MLGWENAFHCEINPFGRQILEYYFPNSKSYEDITKTDFSEWRGKIDVLTGGFPCQPFSYAGQRKGSEDDRYLWPFMLKCIHQIRPTWFVGENVSGITTMVFPGKDTEVGSGGTLFDETHLIRRDERYVIEEICENLEREGYSVQPMLIPACAVGAPHRRDRIFFIARRNDTPDTSCSGGTTYTESGRVESDRSNGFPQQSQWGNKTQRTDGLSPLQGYAPDTSNERLQRSDVSGGQRGIPEEMGREIGDRAKRNIPASSASGRRPTADTDSSRGDEMDKHLQPEFADGKEPFSNGGESDASDTNGKLLSAGNDSSAERQEERRNERTQGSQSCCGTLGARLPEEAWREFPRTQPAIRRGDDGLPFDVDNLTIPFTKWRQESLKAFGNAWVVQVGYEIFRIIDEIEDGKISKEQMGL